MNSMKLAEENVKASLLNKMLKLSGRNTVVNGQWFRKNYFNQEQFSKTSQMYKPKKASFQTSGPCANPIKMKAHFQFILMNCNITLPKMVRNVTLEE